MKSFSITWNTLRDGQFPIEKIKSLNSFDVYVEQVDIFKQKVSFVSNTQEEFTPELAFYIGYLVSSHQHIPTT